MSETRQAFLTGERAEFFAHDRRYVDTIFDDGESPLKHAHDIELRSSSFKWKYPLWYCSDIDAKDCTWFEWHVRAYGTRTISRWRIQRSRRRRISAAAMT